jgi:hypothetical protein
LSAPSEPVRTYANALQPETEGTDMGTFKGKAAGKKVSKLAKAVGDAAPAQPRGDEFDPGKYRVRFLDCSEGNTGALCVSLAGVGDDEEVGERIQYFSTAGKSLHVSAPRLKALCMALVGIDDEEEYAEFDPHREFISAILPYDVDAACAYLVESGKAKNAKAAAALIAGAEFMIKVTKGSDKDDGGFFRDATFALAADAGEDSEDEDDSEDEPESERKPAKKKAAAKAKRAPVEEDEDDAEDEDTDDSEDEDEEPESEPAPKAKKKARHK